jgi:hypothetical protein
MQMPESMIKSLILVKSQAFTRRPALSPAFAFTLTLNRNRQLPRILPPSINASPKTVKL